MVKVDVNIFYGSSIRKILKLFIKLSMIHKYND